MKTNIQETSLEAFHMYKDQLGNLEWKVFQAIHHLSHAFGRGVSDNEILEFLRSRGDGKDWRISDVTGRRNALLYKHGVLIKDEKRENPKTGVKNNTYKIKTPGHTLAKVS